MPTARRPTNALVPQVHANISRTLVLVLVLVHVDAFFPLKFFYRFARQLNNAWFASFTGQTFRALVALRTARKPIDERQLGKL